MITPRLTAGVEVGDAWVSIEYSDRAGDEGRDRYQWYVDFKGGREFSGDDLQSGCVGGSLQSGLESLLSFLGAFAESWRHSREDGENSNLFPAEMAEWAMQNSDEIAMLGCWLEESPGLIEE
jgi:hypothetical protein